MLQHLPAYKGPDVYNRGKDVEDQAFFYVAELEQGIREWVGAGYHRTKHSGLCIPKVPGASFCPTELFEIGLAKTGGLLLPASRDLAYQFLQVPWRTIQHYGVEVNGAAVRRAGVEPAPNTALRMAACTPASGRSSSTPTTCPRCTSKTRRPDNGIRWRGSTPQPCTSRSARTRSTTPSRSPCEQAATSTHYGPCGGVTLSRTATLAGSRGEWEVLQVFVGDFQGRLVAQPGVCLCRL